MKQSKLSFAQKLIVLFDSLVLTLGLGNLVRAVMALRYAALLPDVPMTVPWVYLAAMGGFWGVAFLVCTVGILTFRRWGRWSTLVAVTLYEVHVWVNHFLFDANDYARLTQPRDLALTLLLLTLTWGFLNWSSIRRMFK